MSQMVFSTLNNTTITSTVWNVTSCRACNPTCLSWRISCAAFSSALLLSSTSFSLMTVQGWGFSCFWLSSFCITAFKACSSALAASRSACRVPLKAAPSLAWTHTDTTLSIIFWHRRFGATQGSHHWIKLLSPTPWSALSCSCISLTSMPLLSSLYFSTERASVFSFSSSLLAALRRAQHCMNTTAARTRLYARLASHPRTLAWSSTAARSATNWGRRRGF